MTSHRLLLALAGLLIAAILAVAFLWHPGEDDGPTAAPTADFVLQSADGPLDTRSLRGKVVLVYFGYTYCPDICPTSLYAIGQGINLLTPQEAAQVRVIFVSVDPARDTPARLKEYVGFYHPNMIGVTGSDEQVAAAAKLYGAYYATQKVPGAVGYVVDHSAATYVLSPAGGLVASLPHGTRPAEFATEIRHWLTPSPSSP